MVSKLIWKKLCIFEPTIIELYLLFVSVHCHLAEKYFLQCQAWAIKLIANTKYFMYTENTFQLYRQGRCEAGFFLSVKTRFFFFLEVVLTYSEVTTCALK